MPHVSDFRRVLDPMETISCYRRSRVVTRRWNRWMKDAENLHLDIGTNLSRQSCSTVDIGKV